MATQIKYAFFSILLVIVQTQVMKLLELETIAPDILIIWIVSISLRSGQFAGTVWGFSVGLLFDLLTGNFVGLSAFAKTIGGFAAGFFYNENKTQMTLTSYRFVLIVFIVSFLHNVLYFMIFTRGTEIGLLRGIFAFGLGTALYTSVITLLPMFIISRRRAG